MWIIFSAGSPTVSLRLSVHPSAQHSSCPLPKVVLWSAQHLQKLCRKNLTLGCSISVDSHESGVSEKFIFVHLLTFVCKFFRMRFNRLTQEVMVINPVFLHVVPSLLIETSLTNCAIKHNNEEWIQILNLTKRKLISGFVFFWTFHEFPSDRQTCWVTESVLNCG